MYRSAYVVDGETRYAVVTQFEATDARRAIPCWDEPAVKAKFRLRLTVPSNLIALSNTEEESSTPVPETSQTTVQFAETPLMSTYLLAFVIGEFDHLAGTTESGVPVRVFTPLGKSHLGQHALDVSMKCLMFYELQFGFPYVLKKLDLVAIPDFAAGAMENWGLITYREARLLIDAKKTSFGNLVRTTRTLCHEVSHLWFGDLVTMGWWTDLWFEILFVSDLPA